DDESDQDWAAREALSVASGQHDQQPASIPRKRNRRSLPRKRARASGCRSHRHRAVELAGSGSEMSPPRFRFDMPANSISVRNSYVPSKDGQRFVVDTLLDTAVPPINVVVNWAATMEK